MPCKIFFDCCARPLRPNGVLGQEHHSTTHRWNVGQQSWLSVRLYMASWGPSLPRDVAKPTKNTTRPTDVWTVNEWCSQKQSCCSYAETGRLYLERERTQRNSEERNRIAILWIACFTIRKCVRHTRGGDHWRQCGLTAGVINRRRYKIEWIRKTKSEGFSSADRDDDWTPTQLHSRSLVDSLVKCQIAEVLGNGYVE